MSAIAWDQIQAAIQRWVAAGSGLDPGNVVWIDQKGLPARSKPYIELSVEAETNPAHDWLTKEPNPLVFDALTVSLVDPVAHALTIAAHQLVTGDGPIRFTTTGVLPGNIAPNTDYWIVVVDPNTIRLASTFDGTGGNDPDHENPITTINIASAGSGTLHLSATAATVRAGKEIKRTANGFREVTIRIEVLGAEGSGMKSTAAYRILSDVLAALPHHIDDLDDAGAGMSDLGTIDIQGGIKSSTGKDGGLLEPRSICDVVVFVSSQVVGYIGRAERLHVTANAQLADGTTAAVADAWTPSPPP